MLTRRHALMGAAAMSLAPATRATATADDWTERFNAALRRNPALLGYVSAPPRLDCASLAIEGRWPSALNGTFYRNGPARHEVGGRRYHHWFDGDGMVQAFSMRDGKVSHRGRMVRTDKYRREIAAGRPLERAFGTAWPDVPPPTSAAAINVANINVIGHAGRLLALWEAADAYALDPVTLETLGTQVWRDDLKGMPFSAHPRIEADGTLWGFGYLPHTDRLALYRVGGDGALRHAKLLAVRDLGMVHDFVITARHLVFLLPPISFDLDKARTGVSFLDSYVWRPDRPSRILVVAKETLEIVRQYELPACFVFHFGNGFEEADGTIRFDCARRADPRVMTEELREVMRGAQRPSGEVPSMLVRLDPNGSARTEIVPGSNEFPRVDPRQIGQRYRRIWSVLFDGPSQPGVRRFDLESGKTDIHRYGPHAMVEEHVYVPKPDAGEGEGWLLGTHLDFRAGVTRLAVLDAMNLAAGPIALASLPYPLPLGLHGSFVPG